MAWRAETPTARLPRDHRKCSLSNGGRGAITRHDCLVTRSRWRNGPALLLAVAAFAIQHYPAVGQNNFCLPGPVTEPQPGNSTAGIGWMNAHNRLVQLVQGADRSQGWDLVFFGDSITENWSGYSTGRWWTPTTGIPDVFYRYFGSQYRSGILGIAGDQSYNLLWRMENGEMPQRAPRVVVLLIGTNDLMSAWCNDVAGNGEAVNAEPNNLYSRVQEILSLMHTQWPETRIILMGLLPRGASYADNVEAFRWPNQYTQPFARVNELYQYLAFSDYRVTYVDCGVDFRTSPLNRDIQGDGTHPNARGMAMIAACLQPVVQRLMALPQNTAALRPAQDIDENANPLPNPLANLPNLPGLPNFPAISSGGKR